MTCDVWLSDAPDLGPTPVRCEIADPDHPMPHRYGQIEWDANGIRSAFPEARGQYVRVVAIQVPLDTDGALKALNLIAQIQHWAQDGNIRIFIDPHVPVNTIEEYIFKSLEGGVVTSGFTRTLEIAEGPDREALVAALTIAAEHGNQYAAEALRMISMEATR